MSQRDLASVPHTDEEAITDITPLLRNDPKHSTDVSSIGSIIAILLLGVFVGNADGSLVLATYGSISSEFENLTGSGWIITSYLLAGCATQTLYGKLSDIFGRKTMLIVAYTLFTIGLGICGLSTSLWQFILGRVISGCGGSGMTVLVSIIIADLVPIKDVAIWRSYVNVAATVGRSLGGPLGGLLADVVGWRWSFFGQCPLAILAILLVLWFYQSPKTNAGTAREKFARIDFPGAITMTTTIVSLLLVLDAVKETRWKIAASWAAATLVSGILFVRVENIAEEPVFPPKFLAYRAVITSYLVLMCQVAAQYGMMFTVPIYFQLTQNASFSVAGAHLFPAVAGNAVGGILSGIFIQRTGKYKLITMMATISSGLCYVILIFRWHGETNLWESLEIIPGGFGAGIAQSSTFIALFAGVQQSEISITGAGLYMTSSIGGVLGLASVAAIMKISLESTLKRALSGFAGKEEILSKSLSSLDYVRQLHEPTHNIVVQGYVHSLAFTHGVSLTFSVLGFLASLCMKQHSL